MLDIVITHYNEPFEVGRKLLWMIDLQRCVDFSAIRVTVVNDGGNRLPDGELAKLSYPLSQLDIPHGGISAARNAGIDNATEPYIMFCDFDDVFTNVYALRDIMTVLPCDFDMLWTNLLVEDCLDGKDQIYMTPDRQKFVFVHGKVYRRQFLTEQGLRFNEAMTFQEDSLFNATITARTDYKRIGFIRAPIVPYVWIRRQNSVTNSGRDDEAEYWHFRRNLEVTAENEHDPEKYRGMITRTAYDAFYMVFGKRMGADMKRRILTEFVPWIKERKKMFGKVTDEIMEKLIDISRYELLEPNERIQDDPETVMEWIEKITQEGN
jgi:glycosyltransferase involved in cell wall biosynthesis